MAHIEPVGKPKGRISALKSFRYAPSISTPGDSTPCAVLCMLQHMYPNLKMDMMRFINFFINWFVPLSHSEYYDPAECQRILHATRAVISKHVLPGVFTDMYHDAP